LVFGEVTVNFPEMLAYRGSKPIPMTNMEFKMLKYLIQNARRVISRDELLNEVWGYENYPCTRTVDNHILRLRQKLEREPSRPVNFQTVHGAVSLRLTSIPVASSKKRWSARTKAGLARVRSEGRRLGRPKVAVNPAEIARLRSQGLSLRAIARHVGIGDGSVGRKLSPA
jgi:hypothetical protein